MLDRKGLIALAEHYKMVWRLITKFKRDIHSQMWFYFLMEIALLKLFWLWITIDWICKNKIVVATV